MRLLGFVIAAALALSGCVSIQVNSDKAASPPPRQSSTATAAPVAKPIAKDGPIVIMVGIDGLRWDAIDRHEAPNLRALAKDGVRAQGLIPVMPSVTFVNFYSIATGLYAEHTGITSNLAYSRKTGRLMERGTHGESEWWGGEPIWVTAEKQGLTTAAMFWLGSEAEIAGYRPTYWYPYEHNKPKAERVTQVLDWLAMPEEKRPRLITLYFHDVDSAEHRYGPETPEEGIAIKAIDNNIGDLVAGIKELGLEDQVNLVIVSDHGMTKVKENALIYLDDYISLDDVMVPKFASASGPSGGPFAHIFVKDPANIDKVYYQLANANPKLQVYRRGHLPKRWHVNNNDRTGDIFVVAEPGWLIFARALTSKYKHAPKGMHGYDRHSHDMYGTFIANGPAFKNGIVAEPFDNVNVYGLVADVLGIIPAKTDGNLDSVDYILKE
ncbi:MAG: alkaline phosphatase family protein [Robiginitomaculum sp.]|nr:MAG: alkaline phosphatase family protein [Robiginitomaculum sp.]